MKSCSSTPASNMHAAAVTWFVKRPVTPASFKETANCMRQHYMPHRCTCVPKRSLHKARISLSFIKKRHCFIQSTQTLTAQPVCAAVFLGTENLLAKGAGTRVANCKKHVPLDRNCLFFLMLELQGTAWKALHDCTKSCIIALKSSLRVCMIH